ncbi:MAG: hypothetical protein KAH18_08985, partial [Psychromonas sp.]|nr:hypothetical protein [Psychromonas sp.]
FKISLSEKQREGVKRKVSTTRTLRSSRLGEFKVVVEKGYEHDGLQVVFPDELHNFVPKGKSFSYDSIWEVTKLRYIDGLQRCEIQRRLPFDISTGSVSNLATEGLAYLGLLIESKHAQLKEYYLKNNQPFVLQVDGTNEHGKQVLFVVRESFTGDVLYAQNIKSENTEDIVKILQAVQNIYRRPDAVICDMSSSILSAVREAWGIEVPTHICQFHFLRDLGKDLLSNIHNRVRAGMKKLNVSAELNKRRKRLVKKITEESDDKVTEIYQEVINMIDWVRDYKHSLTGQGVPFDLPFFEYYTRCRMMEKSIDKLLKMRRKAGVKKALKSLNNFLKKIKMFHSLKNIQPQVKKDLKLFREIRDLFDLPINIKHVAPLSQNVAAKQTQAAPQNQQEFQKKLDQIIEKLKTLEQKSKNSVSPQRYKKAIKQLEKYRHQFNTTIVYNGKTFTLPKTNNLCEIGFRAIKQQARRTTGKKNLKQFMDTTPAEAIYLQNFRNKKFHHILFGDFPEYEAFS